jgi:hypothetical protein
LSFTTFQVCFAYDPRALGFKVDKAVLNTDVTSLYLLHIMQLPTHGKPRL